jgi:hypothetical protein
VKHWLTISRRNPGISTRSSPTLGRLATTQTSMVYSRTLFCMFFTRLFHLFYFIFWYTGSMDTGYGRTRRRKVRTTAYHPRIFPTMSATRQMRRLTGMPTCRWKMLPPPRNQSHRFRSGRLYAFCYAHACCLVYRSLCRTITGLEFDQINWTPSKMDPAMGFLLFLI